ncbi:MAG: TIGR04013 family B12-binding domain/radical SAM domain-containing protein [bacterium]|nr:TIGR04013 family B12-binding domain/radical SAM domain-containing protein [bacterium]
MTIFFRKFPNNILTIPVLVNSLENLFGPEELKCFCFFSMEELSQLSAFSDKTFYIVYSFMTTEAEKVYNEVRQIRGLLKNKKYLILGGGSHLNGDDKNYFGFDQVFSGYSEESFPYFLKDAENNSSAYLNKKYLIKDKTVFPADNPILDQSFPFNGSFMTSPPLEIMRGCRQKCNFCQTGTVNKNNFQIRSPESIEKYLIYSKNKTFQRINFISPNAFDYKLPGKSAFGSIEDLLSLCAKYKFKYIEYGIFPSEVRPESVNKEIIGLIKKYCTNKKVTIGGQSGNNRMLKLINRTHSVEDIINASRIIYEAGLTPNIDFIIGFPEETREDRIELFTLIKMLSKKFRAKIQMHYFIPLSGTKYNFKNPTPIDPETQKDLDKLTEGGVILSWWRNGIKLSEQVVNFRDFINTTIS